MKTILITLIALSLFACKKEDETILGTYNVTGKNNHGLNTSGTIKIYHNTMDVNAGLVIPVVEILVDKDKLTCYVRGAIRSGSGSVKDNKLTLNLVVFAPGGGTESWTFTGSK